MTNRSDKAAVVVVGAGVIGLTTAIELAEDRPVTIMAEDFGPASASVKATAVWHVYLVPETKQVLGWAASTLDRLVRIAATEPEAGVEVIRGVELFRRRSATIPAWASIPPYFRMLEESELEAFNTFSSAVLQDPALAVVAASPVRWGYRISAPAADMRTYLIWLMDKAERAGARFEQRHLDSPDDVDAQLVINCSGFGARELVGDTDFEPYKGQYFVLLDDGGAPLEYIGDDDFPTGMTYVIRRAGEVLVGGTAEPGREDLHPTLNWAALSKRAGLYVPWVSTKTEADIERIVVGIRPVRRAGVRLESERSRGRTLIHNYGHGGSGFSLSWGCASSVRSLVAGI